MTPIDVDCKNARLSWDSFCNISATYSNHCKSWQRCKFTSHPCLRSLLMCLHFWACPRDPNRASGMFGSPPTVSGVIWYLSGYLIWFKLYSIVNKQVGQLPCTDFNGLRNWKLGLMFHGGLISFIDFYVTAYDMLWCHIINKRGSFIPFQNQNTFRTDISFLASPWLPGSIGPAKDCDTRSFEFTQIYIKHSTKIFNYVWIILTFMPKIWNRKHRWISKVNVSCGIPPFVFWMFFSCGSPWLSLDVPLR